MTRIVVFLLVGCTQFARVGMAVENFGSSPTLSSALSVFKTVLKLMMVKRWQSPRRGDKEIWIFSNGFVNGYIGDVVSLSSVIGKSRS